MNTLTRSVGKFEFDKEIPLSHAKLVSDTVQGEVLTGQSKITDARSAQAFMRTSESKILAEIQFSYYPAA